MDAFQDFFCSVVVNKTDENTWELNFILPENLPYFQGHFPGQPILPAISIIELTSRILILRAGLEIGELNKLTRAKFMQPISPKSEVRVLVTLNSDKKLSVQWYLETKLAAQYSASYS